MARRRFIVLCVVLLTLYRVGASDDAVEPRDARAFGKAGITNLRVGTEESSSPSAVFSMRRRHSPPTPGALAHLREHDAHRRRRLLESTDNTPAGAATFPLHGSVKEHGYYYADIALGDPSPRTFQVIVDTGSTLTYVPCTTCTKCGTHTGGTKFDPTGKYLTCKEPLCKSAGGPTSCGRGPQANRCHYSRTYAEGSGVTGELVKDKMHFGGDINPTTNGTLDIVFGCTNAESGTIHDQEADGLIGLGNNQFASIPNQLHTTHGLPLVFSLCFGSFEGGGALSFGRLPSTPHTPTLKYTPMTRNNAHPAYYVVKTSEMKIGDTAVASSGDLSVGYGTVMDSGTTFTYVPTKVFHATAAALDAAVTTGNGAESKLVKVSGPDPGYPDDVCFQRAGATATAPIVTMDNLGDYYPPLTLTFDGEGASLVLPPSNYLFAHGKKPGAFCLGVMDNKSQGTLIGGISVRNVLVEYDKTVDGGRIGFATTNCDAMLADHLARQSGANANAKAAGNETNGAGAAPVVNEVTPPPPPQGSDLGAGDVKAKSNGKSNGYTEADAGGYVLGFVLCAGIVGACVARLNLRRGRMELPYLGEVRFFEWRTSGYVEVDGDDDAGGGRGGGGLQLASISSSLD